MIGIRRHHESPRPNGEQVVCPHEPRHPFVVHQQAAPAHFRHDAPGDIPTPVFDGDPLNGRLHVHVFFHWLVRPQRPKGRQDPLGLPR
jgi:hypothetical protein